MIPRVLQLKNFLSYGPELQVIDFAHYNLICLSGKNGHGKSALLDAITWAIWGQARKSCGNSKADAGLVHLGQNHMMVILEFEVNGTVYRVRREFVQTKSKPFASLDFGIKQTDDKLIALTDKTIKDTQEKIERTIGITYESFVNSTFLRQGQSNEFSKKSPKERKEILAQILQLQRFEEQKKIALIQSKKLQLQLLTQKNISARIEQELMLLANSAQHYSQATEQIKALHNLKKEILEQQAALSAHYQTLIEKNKAYEILKGQGQHAAKNIIVLQNDIDHYGQLWHQTNQKIKHIDVSDLKKQEQMLQQTVGKHQKAFEKKLELKELYLNTRENLQQTSNQANQAFEKIKQGHTNTLMLLEKEIMRASNELARLQAELTKHQQESVKHAQNQTQYIATCPTCKQDLDTAKQKLLHEQLAQGQARAQQEVVQKMQLLQQERANFTAQLDEQKKSYEQSEKKHQILLQGEPFAQLAGKLLAIETEGKALGYQQTEHAQAQAQLTALQKDIELVSFSAQTAQAQTERKLQLFALFKQIKQESDTLETLQESLKTFDGLENELVKTTHELHVLHGQKQDLDNREQQALIDQATRKNQLDKKIALEQEITTLERDAKTVEQEMIDYHEIAKALGKDGIQALLIEQAIPEIEHETNQVLARLTSNQTQIFIESLRDLKKGGSKETLDIKISDQFGLRDYEMFSGGEAFRIDFALRIGISKLLARRAGTTLQTIFIDEGFGSQDEEGLQLIMDNLYKIQDDFAKIIIVSHLPEMKEQFPVQFIVDKKRSGSTISVVHQG